MPPRKKKSIKKPISDESDDSDSFKEPDEEPEPKKKQVRKRNTKKKEIEKEDEDNEEPKEDENIELTISTEGIKEGANDLMNLPIEVIQEELIKRNYYPKVIKHFPKNILVSMLREESKQVHETKRNKGDLVTKKGATMRNSHKNKPIFNTNNDPGEKEEEAVPDEENNEEEIEQGLPVVKPSEFL